MHKKTQLLYVAILVSFSLSVAFAQDSLASKANSSGESNAPMDKKGSKGKSHVIGKFVTLPQDIQYLLHDATTTFGFVNGELKGKLSSVKAITCHIDDSPEKDIPLVGIQPDGTLLTKDFGKLKIYMKNEVDPVTSRGSVVVEHIEIQSDMLKSLREFLQGK